MQRIPPVWVRGISHSELVLTLLRNWLIKLWKSAEAISEDHQQACWLPQKHSKATLFQHSKTASLKRCLDHSTEGTKSLLSTSRCFLPPPRQTSAPSSKIRCSGIHLSSTKTKQHSSLQVTRDSPLWVSTCTLRNPFLLNFCQLYFKVQFHYICTSNS